MAVERRGSFAMPALKRQRLENENTFEDSEPTVNSFNSSKCVNDNIKASKKVFENAQFEYQHNLSESSGNTSSSSPSLKSFNKCIENGKNHSSAITNNPISSDDDGDDVASTLSDISGLSDVSDLSGHEWKPISGPISWVQHQINNGSNPRLIIQELVPKETLVPLHLDDITLWKIIVNIVSEPPRRTKLSHINTLDDVVNLLKVSKNVIVLTGAGVSVSSGIPDFRSTNGIYARLSKDFPDLPDPQAMFDIHYFKKDPRPFFKFAKEIYPGQFKPSVSHYFIKLLQEQGKLLRNYSQNIDTLEKAAGITRAITCHGSFATASCTRCCFKVDCSVIKDDIFNQRIPLCPKCSQHESSRGDIAVMKPDIVFFGEGLSDEFHKTMGQDKDVCDLLIVMGSSLKVRPVALIPSSIPSNIPQILINREPLNHLDFDVQLLGDCDVIIEEICRRLGSGWSHVCQSQTSLQEVSALKPTSKCNIGTSSLGTDNLQIAKDKFVSEVNNNCHNSIAEDDLTSVKDDESNSCGCSQLAGIHLADSTSNEIHSSTSQCSDDSHSDHSLGFYKNCTIASQLPERSFLFLPPSRYIFSGAEVEMVNDYKLLKDVNVKTESEPISDTKTCIISEKNSDCVNCSTSKITEIDCDNFRNFNDIPVEGDSATDLLDINKI